MDKDEHANVLKKLLLWLEDHPEAEAQKIPEMCICFLNKAYSMEILNKVTNERKRSFRNSFRQVILHRNKIWPIPKQRSVTFAEEATIYCINK